MNVLSKRTTTFQRLLPLYAATFLQGFVLWYAIEKLFMTEIGFTAATIGVMAASFSVVTLLLEAPSGVLADRWSRKGVLILAGAALAISSLICGLSDSLWLYIIGAGFWGMFAAFTSGTTDAIVYDTLLEETGTGRAYEKYYGYAQLVEGVALTAGALLGGLVAFWLGLQTSYFLSIVTAVLSIGVLLIFKEPQLHKAETHERLLAHIRSTFRATLRRDTLVGVLIVLVLGEMVGTIILEYNQLWLIAISAPVFAYGFANAPLMAALGGSGLLAPRLRLYSRAFVIGFSVLLIAAALGLMLTQNIWLIVSSQTILTVGIFGLGIVYLKRLHDQLPSKVRAGASSAVGTMGKALFIGVSLVFGLVAEQYSIFTAGWFVLVPVVVICVFLYAEVTPRST